MYAKDPKNTDDYIEILKGLDNREKLKIISALTDSMLASQEEKKNLWKNSGASFQPGKMMAKPQKKTSLKSEMPVVQD